MLWLWWRTPGESDQRRRMLLLSLLAAILAIGVNTILNTVLPRPRPFLVLPAHVLVKSPPHDSSFPSDHAAVTLAIATTLLLNGESGWGVLGVMGALAIGLARVIIGVHYPSDIVGGMLVGMVCAVIVTRVQTSLGPVLTFVLKVMRRVRLA